MTKKTEKPQAPFPYFGGKRTVAKMVWERLGNVPNYVEPFAGSVAMLLNRPHVSDVETINDMDGFVSNFWRAVKKNPVEVAGYADWPVNENDLHARHYWLVSKKESLQAKLEGDPDYFDTKVAGWWCWGICCWIGKGFCSGNGPWKVVDGSLVHLGNKGQGINRSRVHLGNKGRGINRSRVHLGDKGILNWMESLAERLRMVRVCCGDWKRVTTRCPTTKVGLTGMFLDPPYSYDVDRCGDLYNKDSSDVSNDVREWCMEWGDDPLMRIALCGYEGEHDMPDSWVCIPWKAVGGYGSQSKTHNNDNAKRERVWFSPHCLDPARKRGLVF